MTQIIIASSLIMARKNRICKILNKTIQDFHIVLESKYCGPQVCVATSALFDLKKFKVP